MIIFQDLSKHYGDSKVLDQINCSIDAGEFVFFVGASGAGKSTLLHLLIGAEEPTSGCIFVDQVNICEISTRPMQLYRRNVGMVFQDYKLLPRKTVYENIQFALQAIDTNPAQIPGKVSRALKEVGLSGKEDAFPEELSGGEMQRVAIARALVHDPNLIIADEPTGNLDPQTGREIMELLNQINKNKVTVLVATHNDAIVNDMRKRVIQIDKGKIVSDRIKGKYS